MVPGTMARCHLLSFTQSPQVFRSGSVIASLVVGSLLLNKQYSLKTVQTGFYSATIELAVTVLIQVIAVLVTTAGVVLLSLASAPANADKQATAMRVTGVGI